MTGLEGDGRLWPLATSPMLSKPISTNPIQTLAMHAIFSTVIATRNMVSNFRNPLGGRGNVAVATRNCN